MIPREPYERTLVVGTAPPTRCGLATYTVNVRDALRMNGVDAHVLRLLNRQEPSTPIPAGVIGEWRDGTRDGARHAAELANEFSRVLVQHEYGIYPGDDGIEVIDFLEHQAKPAVTVLHTVLLEPSPRQRLVLSALVENSSTLIVHGTTAKARLLDVVPIDPDRVVVIPHGATLRKRHSAQFAETRPSMLTWGLIGPGKGLEHGVAAVARLRGAGLDVDYLIAGATHPNVRRSQGERYRHELLDLADGLGVRDLIHFDNRYCTWREQQEWIDSASVVLLPYDNPDQVTSGVLVEALAAGKPVIATAFSHARELADTGALMIVDHSAPAEIATAMHALATDHELRGRMETAARIEGMRCDWGVVGHRYAEVLHSSDQFATSGGSR